MLTVNHDNCRDTLRACTSAKWEVDDFDDFTARFGPWLSIEVKPPAVLDGEFQVFLATKDLKAVPRACKTVVEVPELVSAAFAEGYANLLQFHDVRAPRIPSWAREHVRVAVEARVKEAEASLRSRHPLEEDGAERRAEANLISRGRQVLKTLASR